MTASVAKKAVSVFMMNVLTIPCRNFIVSGSVRFFHVLEFIHHYLTNQTKFLNEKGCVVFIGMPYPGFPTICSGPGDLGPGIRCHWKPCIQCYCDSKGVQCRNHHQGGWFIYINSSGLCKSAGNFFSGNGP